MSRSASYDELLTVCIQNFYTAEIIPRDTPATIVARQRPQARVKERAEQAAEIQRSG